MLALDNEVYFAGSPTVGGYFSTSPALRKIEKREFFGGPTLQERLRKTSLYTASYTVVVLCSVRAKVMNSVYATRSDVTSEQSKKNYHERPSPVTSLGGSMLFFSLLTVCLELSIFFLNEVQIYFGEL